MSLRDESSACTMTLDARGTYGCYAKANETPRRGKIVRGETEEAINTLVMDDAMKKEEEKDESVYVVTVPMTMMKSTLEKVKSGDLKASGVLVEHPLAFIEDSRAVVAAEKEAAESGFYRVRIRRERRPQKSENRRNAGGVFRGECDKESCVGGGREREEREENVFIKNNRG